MGVPELPLDDDERHSCTGHLDGTCVSQLMGRKSAADPMCFDHCDGRGSDQSRGRRLGAGPIDWSDADPEPRGVGEVPEVGGERCDVGSSMPGSISTGRGEEKVSLRLTTDKDVAATTESGHRPSRICPKRAELQALALRTWVNPSETGSGAVNEGSRSR
jgi:hypothetical protein